MFCSAPLDANLGAPGGAALLIDYILLAAVAVSSGVAQIVSAYPVLFPHRVLLAVGLLVLIMIANLRGVKESGTAFALPTYFLIMMIVTVGAGLFRYLTRPRGGIVISEVPYQVD